MITLRKVTKTFGGLVAVNKFTAHIRKGKITAIIGPNGSGKSTLFNLITGVLQEDEGSITLNKESIEHLSIYERSQKGISRTFQDVKIFSNLSIEDHLQLALAKDTIGLWASITQKEPSYKKKIKETLELVGLTRDKKTWGNELSYGQQKLLSLAISIANDHKILLLDEPVAGVNPTLREKIKKIIKTLKKQGDTVVIIEHDMNFVMDLADEVLVMDEGKLLVQGTPKKVRDDPRVLEAYLGD